MSYDSRPDTYAHIHQVQQYMHRAVKDLLARALRHDRSKLESPELEVFDEYTPKLAEAEYGSDEYKAFLVGMQEGLRHHYVRNSHHPEHDPRGIAGMSLLDLVEMLCDWKAATLRSKDGDLLRSITLNQERFGYTDELREILVNTAQELALLSAADKSERGTRRAASRG